MASLTVPRTKKPRHLGALAAAWEIFKKDARIELRTREVIATAGVFALMVGTLASIAYVTVAKYNRATAAGTIWIAMFFAAVLSFSRIWQRERDESALTSLLVSPIPRASIFLGKALATFGTILVIALPLVTLTMFLFAIDFSPPDDAMRDPRAVQDPWSLHVGAFVALLTLGIAALSLVGTLFGAMTVRTRARDLVLAIVLFPLLSPVLVCGVAGSRNAFETQPFEDYRAFVGMMGLSVFVFAAIGVALFGYLVDE